MRDEILADRSGFLIGHDHFLTTFRCRSQLNGTGNFRNDRGGTRTSRFKEFDNARESARDVLRLCDFLRNLGDDVAFAHLIAVFDVKIDVDRQGIASYSLAAFNDGNLRMETFGAMLDDDALG